MLFAASSGHGLVSLTSVLASLYPIVTVLLAAAVLHEHVARTQKAGIVHCSVVLISVALGNQVDQVRSTLQRAELDASRHSDRSNRFTGR